MGTKRGKRKKNYPLKNKCWAPLGQKEAALPPFSFLFYLLPHPTFFLTSSSFSSYSLPSGDPLCHFLDPMALNIIWHPLEKSTCIPFFSFFSFSYSFPFSLVPWMNSFYQAMKRDKELLLCSKWQAT